MYRRGTDGAPAFVEAPAPTDEALDADGVAQDHHPDDESAHPSGGRLWKRRVRPIWLTTTVIRTRPARSGHCRPGCTYRIAVGPRAGQKGPDAAGRHAQGCRVQAEPVRRQQRLQPARRGALRGRRPAGAGTTVPLHHPPGTGQRTGTDHRRRTGSAQARDPLAQRHHATGDFTVGLQAATGGGGPAAATATYDCFAAVNLGSRAPGVGRGQASVDPISLHGTCRSRWVASQLAVACNRVPAMARSSASSSKAAAHEVRPAKIEACTASSPC